MIADTKNAFPRFGAVAAKTGLVLACPRALLSPSRAQEAAPKPAGDGAADGLFITVHDPITTTIVNRVKDKTQRFLQRPDHRGLTIVYDFNPDSHASGTGDYGPCH